MPEVGCLDVGEARRSIARSRFNGKSRIEAPSLAIRDGKLQRVLRKFESAGAC